MIVCKNLTKTYINGDVTTNALANVSFSIEKGEFVSIIGPSGSGKSTLMHIIGALDTPTSGEYSLDGKEVSKLSDDELSDLRRDKIGFVFQSFNLLPRTTVLRNVMLPLLYTNTTKKEREERAEQSLQYAGMEKDKFMNLSNQLSGGQMQRVAIARALINNPAIILADEPTGNLDTKTSHLVMSALQELNKKGHTIILITHEMDVADYANRIIHIRDGMIEKDEINIPNDHKI
ncbi:MAG TPA: ABC transporter ATP-binding protein [Candidatus Moranbacteria bacterium]|nr:ABC transporter ATP-binding protein [Candidatus Moranbacteria bacterium]HRY27960.1 ABC transporter ATP-binding protein [Candidatus Moranbacteria bacterium]HSA08224.1 ABC transporter ATP-binding protein [Candidatus Moranbacteria bacterium]